MKPAPKGFKLFYGFLKPLIPERIPLHVFPSLVRYLLREHFTFDPIKDPTICPLFGQDGVRCWRCGGQTRLEYHDRFGPRLVHGMARDFYVMGVSLECLNKFGCKKPVINPKSGKMVSKKIRFSSLNAKFIESLRGKLECVRNKLPFEVLCLNDEHERAMTLVDRDLMSKIQTLGHPKGTSGGSLELEIEEAHRNKYVRIRTLYTDHVAFYKEFTFASRDPNVVFEEFPCFEEFSPKLIGAKTLRSLYIQDFKAREPYQNRLMACIFGDILSVDVTHLRSMLNGVGINKHLTVMNENNLILVHLFISSESKITLRDIVIRIRQRIWDYNEDKPDDKKINYPSVMFLDCECCSGHLETDRERHTAMRELWGLLNPGKTVLLKLDVWHWMHRLTDGLHSPGHIYAPRFFSAIRIAVFMMMEKDYEKLLIAFCFVFGYTEEDTIKNKLIPVREICTFCRRGIPGPTKLRHSLQSVYAVFST